MKRKNTELVPQNNTLLNLISPQGLKFGTSDLEFSDMKAKSYGILKYPGTMPYGWMSKITNMDGCLTCVNVNPVTDVEEFVTALNKNINQKQSDVINSKSPLQRQRAERAVEDGNRLLKQIDDQNNAMCQMAITYTAEADNENSLNRICRKAQSTITTIGCRTRLLSRRQDIAFKQCLPTFGGQNDMNRMCGRIVPLRTVIGGFPFSSSCFTDNKGDYFARASDGSVIMLDIWKRGDDRTNSNMVIMGQAGQGKSTVIKSIAITEFKNGTKIIFIDPESEYRDLCHNLQGDYINAGGGKFKINPLQIRPAPRDEDEEKDKLYEDDGNGIGDLALHIKNLEIFFNMYLPDLTIIQKAILKKCIIELYKSFNIVWDTDVTCLKNTDFPIFSDLHELIEKKANENKKDEDYKILGLLLEDIAHGSDSFLWNGHTTINPKSNCICLDTNSLQETADTVKRTQYFNLLSWCWQQMSEDRDKKVMLFADEAYLMIDPQVPQALSFIRNVEKRARKYESAIAVISHSVVDFLDPAIKRYGQAVLDIPCFKILFGTDGQNLAESKKLYKLTDAEEELLLRKKRGNGLCIFGAKRVGVKFDLPKYRLDLMGRGGGR